MRTQFVYLGYEGVNCADRLRAVPEASEWATMWGIIKVTRRELSDTLLLQIRPRANAVASACPEDQMNEVARSVLKQLALVEDWKESLTRSQITVSANQTHIFAAVCPPGVTEQWDDNYLSGILNLVNIMLIGLLQDMLRCGIELVEVLEL